ncbi:holo-ACP synthase [Labrys sp. KNU-23]|uniref:holo-ACP synthase n=1 Tax=Labrys sp. KNU-23 TaxID=2789216 RepID=UPI0011F086E1|nr:holo-ACP synthase [Labrys sp. KNU-23]QEN90506.1 holo-ACP synthase [Labrys sp. KNU-23]
MIIGIGSDLCDIRRIEDALVRFGERFERRCFTEGERAKAAGRADKAGTLAKRFAAKEACSKALGTGINGIHWHDMEILNAESGRPELRLTGAALRLLEGLLPAGHEAHIHLSLTDEHPLAQAFVVIEARPRA